MKNNKLVLLCGLLSSVLLSGCVATSTPKAELFPNMYSNVKSHNNILIAPIINESTSVNASEFLNATLAEPFANKGYYVLPVPITADIFKDAGIVDGKELSGVPFYKYKENFGADTVLFVTVPTWDTEYLVIAGSVTVSLKYVMVSTDTSEIIWSYQNTLVIDTSASSGNLLADLIITAISTATTDYIPIARQVNDISTQSLPVGEYHPRYKQDGKDLVLDENVKQAKDAFVN